MPRGSIDCEAGIGTVLLGVWDCLVADQVMDSDNSDSEDEQDGEPKARELCNGQPFPKDVVAVLDSFYERGMTGWGQKH